MIVMPRRLRLPALRGLLLALLLPASLAAAACGDEAVVAAPRLLELVVTSDRGDPYDRSFRVRLHTDGCLALRRPAFHREPGEHVGQINAAALQAMQSLASQPELRGIDPEAALARAQSTYARAGASSAHGDVQPRATFVSHPTWYVLRLFSDDGALARELRMESVLQHAELHPQDTGLATLAEAVQQLLAIAEFTPTQARDVAEPQP